MASNVPSFVPFKKSDYGDKGLGDKDGLDKFFTALNTQNQSLLGTLNGGLDFSNLNGQSFEFTLQTPATDWLTMTLTAGTSGWTAFSGGGWKAPRYRVDGSGRVYCSGLLASSNSPVAGEAFWSFPSTQYGPKDATAAAGRLFSCPMNSALGDCTVRIDAYSGGMSWVGEVTGDRDGTLAWNNLTLATYNNLTTIQYAKSPAGRVYLQGAFSSNAGATGATMATLPTGYRPARTCRYPIIVQTTAPAFPAGTLTINTDGTMVTEFTGGITIAKCGLDHISFDSAVLGVAGTPVAWLSLDGCSWDSLGAPQSMSCFPLNVRVEDNKKVKGVFITAVQDTDQSAAAPQIQPGPANWIPNQAKTGFPNSFSILGIPGLGFNRKYVVRGVALFQ
jgi:hypothetical protein